jgi:CheY-like chemotaxis protein
MHDQLADRDCRGLQTVASTSTPAVIIWNGRVRIDPNCFSALPSPHLVGRRGESNDSGRHLNGQKMVIASSSESPNGHPMKQQTSEGTSASANKDSFEVRPNKPVQIVVVEDNAGDVDLLRQALADQQIAYHLHVLEDGRKALSFFEGIINEGRELPSFIILDLNLPAVHGLTILERIRGVPRLQSIPVAILTSSTLPEERNRATAAGVEAYWRKPHSLDELEALGQSLTTFFKQYNILEPSGRAQKDAGV